MDTERKVVISIKKTYPLVIPLVFPRLCFRFDWLLWVRGGIFELEVINVECELSDSWHLLCFSLLWSLQDCRGLKEQQKDGLSSSKYVLLKRTRTNAHFPSFFFIAFIPVPRSGVLSFL